MVRVPVRLILPVSGNEAEDVRLTWPNFIRRMPFFFNKFAASLCTSLLVLMISRFPAAIRVSYMWRRSSEGSWSSGKLVSPEDPNDVFCTAVVRSGTVRRL